MHGSHSSISVCVFVCVEPLFRLKFAFAKRDHFSFLSVCIIRRTAAHTQFQTFELRKKTQKCIQCKSELIAGKHKRTNSHQNTHTITCTCPVVLSRIYIIPLHYKCACALDNKVSVWGRVPQIGFECIIIAHANIEWRKGNLLRKDISRRALPADRRGNVLNKCNRERTRIKYGNYLSIGRMCPGFS